MKPTSPVRVRMLAQTSYGQNQGISLPLAVSHCIAQEKKTQRGKANFPDCLCISEQCFLNSQFGCPWTILTRCRLSDFPKIPFSIELFDLLKNDQERQSVSELGTGTIGVKSLCRCCYQKDLWRPHNRSTLVKRYGSDWMVAASSKPSLRCVAARCIWSGVHGELALHLRLHDCN